MRRGILGGTFDPPHMAHLAGGEAVYRGLGLDAVLFVPAGSPWQKAGTGVTAAHHRLEMTRRAVAGVPYFAVDDREVSRDGWTYTADTLATFPAAEELTLILGADAALNLPSWDRAEEVVDRARIAVVPRPGVARASVEDALDGADLMWADTPELDLSGTALRAHAFAGGSLRFLVPDQVWRYVEDHGLYRPL